MKNNYDGRQEHQISKAGVLNKKNLYKILVILRDMYPAGYMYKNLKKRSGIKIMSESQLKELVDEKLLKLFDLSEPYKKSFPEHGKMFPQYTITTSGMNFLNSLETYNLNKKIKQFTEILIVFGIITIFLMATQLFFTILKY